MVAYDGPRFVKSETPQERSAREKEEARPDGSTSVITELLSMAVAVALVVGFFSGLFWVSAYILYGITLLF